MTPDPWQFGVLEDWLAVRKDGRYASLTCGLAVPRQNGKNGLIEVRELYGMVVAGEKFLHTAHEVKTARKAFLRLASFFEDERKRPELAALVKEIRRTNGQEAIVLTNGGSVEFVARSKGSGRGFTVDVLVMDEAQELSDDALEALMPTTSAAPLGNPQWILTGTPPGPSANGEVFTRTREEALARKGGRICWHEWSCEAGVDLDDRALWHAANPSLGLRLQYDVIEGERARFSDEGFARERLGVWSPEGTVSGVIPLDSWDMAGDEMSLPADRFALGIEVAPDATHASVSLAGQRSDGRWHVELDDRRDGSAWVVPYVKRLIETNPQLRAVVVDAGSPSKVLLEEFEAAKVRVVLPRVSDLGAAHTKMLEGIVTGQVVHTKQPQMRGAVAVATKRTSGDSGLWFFRRASAAADITPIQSATLALFGAQSSNVKRPSGNSAAYAF